MIEQVLDVKGSYRVVRRCWRAVLLFTVAGLAVAAGYQVSAPPRFEASALVLLPLTNAAGAAQGPAAGGTTQARVATSAAVLVPASRHLHPAPSFRQLQQDVSTSKAAASVLKITATGSTARRARMLANAVADQLVVFSAVTGSSTSSNVVAGLQAEASQLTTQLSNVKAQLATANQHLSADTTPAARAQDSALVDKLTSEQSNLALQLSTVKSQIAQAQLQVIAANQGTQVIQRATEAAAPSIMDRVPLLALGAIAGLAAGVVAVLLWQRRERRLWSRDALAEAVGAPILLSLDVRKRRSRDDWVELLHHYQPSALEQWTVRRALRELEVADGGTSHLRVLATASDAAAAALALHVAVTAATSGTTTRLSVAADDEDGTALRAACARFFEDDARANLLVVDHEPEEDEDPPELSMTLVLVDQGRSLLSAAVRPETITVLAVSSGASSGEQLARVAIAAADAGSPLTCAFVANPVANDHTVGRLAAKGARGPQGPPRRAIGPRFEAPAGSGRDR